MDLILNFGFAWLSIILTILLSIIYILRVYLRNQQQKNKFLASLNKQLRNYHKELGILLVITGFIHGYYSSTSIFTFNFGTICWLFSIILGLNFMFRKSLSRYKNWMKLHRTLSVIFLVTILIHVVEVGGIQVFTILSDITPKTESVQIPLSQTNDETVTSFNTTDGALSPDEWSEDNGEDSVNYALSYGTFKDGVYTGTATGYRDGLQVQIEIKNNTLVDLQIISHNEINSRYYQKAMDAVPDEIIDSQSVTVDTISGATFTSIGIMNATNDALSQALISGSLPDLQSLPTNKGHGRH